MACVARGPWPVYGHYALGVYSIPLQYKGFVMNTRIGKLVMGVALLALAQVSPALADTLDVRLDKAQILRLDVPAAIIVVGNPDIADVTVENPTLLFVMGRSAGETNLLILDETGEEIANLDLAVIGELDRHVTVHRDTIQISTFSCDPRCIEVANPSDVERERQFVGPEEDDGDIPREVETEIEVDGEPLGEQG